jgi:hypothetical protein
VTDPVLRAKLAELVHARDEEAEADIVARHGAVLWSDAAQFELTAWLAELREDRRLAARIEEIGTLLAIVRNSIAQGPGVDLFDAGMQVEDIEDMMDLVAGAEPEALDALDLLFQQRVVAATGPEAEKLQERLDLLRLARDEVAIENSPLLCAVYEYLDAPTPEAARALLQAQPDLLLTAEAEDELQLFEGDTAEDVAFLAARRDLLHRTRSLA